MMFVDEPLLSYDLVIDKFEDDVEYESTRKYKHKAKEKSSVKPKQQWSKETLDEFTNNIRTLIIDKLTIKTKGPNGSEFSSTVFIDDKTAKDIANGILFYIEKEVMKNPNREIPEGTKL